jgi:hypothetical protein
VAVRFYPPLQRSLFEDALAEGPLPARLKRHRKAASEAKMCALNAAYRSRQTRPLLKSEAAMESRQCACIAMIRGRFTANTGRADHATIEDGWFTSNRCEIISTAALDRDAGCIAVIVVT